MIDEDVPTDPQELLLYGEKLVTKVEDLLAKLFQWYDFRELVCHLSALRRSDPGLSDWPVHTIAHLICASCAYGSKINQPVSREVLVKARNLLTEVINPAYLIAISNSDHFDMFGQVIWREQLAFQRTMSLSTIGRYCWLLDRLMSKCGRDILTNKIGVPITELLRASWLLAAWFASDPSFVLRMHHAPILVGLNVTPHQLGAIRSRLAVSGEKIGEDYKNRFKMLHNKAYFWASNSILAEKPLITLDNSSYACPFPGLIPTSLYRSIGHDIRQDKHLQAEFSKSFARYVELVIDDLQPLDVWNPDRAKRNDISCDIVARFVDCDVLIECKSTRFSHRIVNPKTIVDDTSTKEIGHAFIQLANSVEFTQINRIPIIVVDDYLAFANSDWYFERICERNPGIRDAVRTLGMRPLIWTLDALEVAVRLSLWQRRSLWELVREYTSIPYHQRGDLEVWASQLPDIDQMPSLSWLIATSDTIRP